MTLSLNWGALQGTASIEPGSVTLVGTDTEFQRDLQPGDEIVVGQVTAKVQAIRDDGLQLTLAEPFDGKAVRNVPISKKSAWSRFRSPFHSFMIIVVGTLAILLTGLLVSRFRGSPAGRQAPGTLAGQS
jgi:hypothetical protein